MKRNFLISAIVVIFVFAVFSSQLFAKQTIINKFLPLKSGDYLSKKYLEVLEKKLSPYAAEGSRTINTIVVEKIQNGIEILSIINFHEGGPTFQVNELNVVKVKERAGFDMKHYTVKIIDRNKVLIGFDDFPPEIFIWVEDINRTLRSKTIVGKYVDSKGQIYSFDPGGLATTPTGNFKYTIGIDHIPYKFDYIEDSDKHLIYRFDRKDKCHLNIYKVLDAVENQYGNDGSHVTLFASLRDINCIGE